MATHKKRLLVKFKNQKISTNHLFSLERSAISVSESPTATLLEISNITKTIQDNAANIELWAEDESFVIRKKRKRKKEKGGIVTDTTNEQWSLNKIGWDAEQVKQLLKGKSESGTPPKDREEIKIAIIDTGINTHFELNNLIINQICLAPDMAPSDTTDVNNHGTAVAGIIAAPMGNGGIDGIFPGVNLINIKVTNSRRPDFYISAIYDGIYHAIKNGAKIINISWNYQNKAAAIANLPVNSKTNIKYFIDEAIDVAYNKGIIVVFSLGDNNIDVKDALPDNTDKIIIVGACNEKLDILNGSNYTNNPNIDIIYAPGDNVKSTNIFNDFEPFEGSSFAAPHVSALVGLMLFKNPALTFTDVKNLIFSNAKKVTKNGKTINVLNIKDTLTNTL